MIRQSNDRKKETEKVRKRGDRYKKGSIDIKAIRKWNREKVNKIEIKGKQEEYMERDYTEKIPSGLHVPEFPQVYKSVKA